jgi:LmbE family N-acetylglucosaminyl deacetylase
MNSPLQPPGWTERVRAESALVLAPHYDDEVLGCGGLLAQLAASGAAVRVLFLSDGGGGGETVEDREGYRQRRREESGRVCEILGLAGCDHLGLPDGGIDQHLDAAVAGIRRAVLTQRPDLLLVPSPLEVSRDHRATFAALHRLLGPVRDASPAPAPSDTEPLRGLRVFLYEVNHPGHPDLLVDVTAEALVLEKAMAAYASQEERHPYWNAGLGLRQFRTLSLAPGVELAEAYRRLRVEDFTTRSPTQLVRHLGGLPEIHEIREGPRISVVVRTRNRPKLLAEALDSLAQGEYRRAEVVLVNDGGEPPTVPDGYPLPVNRLDLAENRGRAAAAEAGVAAATGDYVTFLDDDDLAAPEHLATLAGLVSAAGVRVAYTDAAVAIYDLDGDREGNGWVCRERRLPYSRDFDADVLLVDNYIPFNTLLIERSLFAEAGPFDTSLPFFEDWDFLIRLAAITPFHHLARVTCEYRHFRGGSHHIFGERPRERSDFLAVKALVLSKHARRLGPAELARAVDILRAELVDEREARGAARREAEALRGDLAHLRGDFGTLQRELAFVHGSLASTQGNLASVQGELNALSQAHQDLARERFQWEERYHTANGELTELRAELGRLQEARGRTDAEVQRLYEEERRLRAAIDDQTAHLGRTYAEIERLNGILREMESTRAWRAHQWWSRRTS